MHRPSNIIQNFYFDYVFNYSLRETKVCARLAQLVRSLTANQKVPGSIPGLVEG